MDKKELYQQHPILETVAEMCNLQRPVRVLSKGETTIVYEIDEYDNVIGAGQVEY